MWELKKRTFSGSKTISFKDPLNCHPITSRFQKSYKWCVVTSDQKYCKLFKTKKSALEFIVHA